MITRRDFIIGTAASAFASFGAGRIFAQTTGTPLKAVVFWEAGFPSIDGMNLSKAVLDEALAGHSVRYATSSELASTLGPDTDVFINPFGSAFPKTAWNAILKYLKEGGNLLNLGGRPFSVPVGADRKPQAAQTNYHKRLGITQYFTVKGADHESFSSPLEGVNFRIRPARVFETYVKLSNVNDFPDEAGSDGRREANVRPLMSGHRKWPEGLLDPKQAATEDIVPAGTFLFPLSAPVVEINRLQGDFAGGRWVLANYEGPIDAATIRALAAEAAFGAFEVTARPVYAVTRPNETPRMRIAIAGREDVKLTSAEIRTGLAGGGRGWTGKVTVSPRGETVADLAPLPAGFYHGDLIYTVEGRAGRTQSHARQVAFWVDVERPAVTGSPFKTDRHFLRRDDRPFPVTGTTYMSSTVARRFLLEADPFVWDKDFAEMKSARVNMIRTGIWTGWELYFDPKGEVREEVLRAFEAFILTARRYDIPVNFTFFAFMPLMFGGKNAYLDPKSIAGQKKFLTAFALRARMADDVSWDLINEPSFANPKALWSCRPNYDEFEKAAWKEWLKKRFGEADEARLADKLQDAWRLRADEDPFALPPMKDFENTNIHVDRRPLRVVDFRLFAQDTFTAWAVEMRNALREVNPRQLVMVGQDEAGTGDSPAQQFHGGEMDLTGLHNWWANDDLLFDSIVTKHPTRPNLVQETGLMFYEKQDGGAWRNDETAANLLERKMALSLGANGAGFIQWIWNINPFMDNENEAAIGFIRHDGSVKPELERFVRMAKFANVHRDLFDGKLQEDVLLVIPHSQMYTARNLATEATKRAVRTLEYQCRIACRAVGEYQVTAFDEPQLIVLPAPRTLSEQAWRNVLGMVYRGSTLAVTGFFEEDEYFRSAVRLGAWTKIGGARPIAQFEEIRRSPTDRGYIARFAGEKLQRIERADVADTLVQLFPHGKGKILWCPVPLENSDSMEALTLFYNQALRVSGLKPQAFPNPAQREDVLIRVTRFRTADLYACINESSARRNFYLWGKQDPIAEVDLEPGRAKLIFVDRATGKLLGAS